MRLSINGITIFRSKDADPPHPIDKDYPLAARRSRTSNGSPVIGLLLAFAFVIAGVGMLLETIFFQVTSVKAIGEVVEVHESVTEKGEVLYSPTFKWRDQSGGTQTGSPSTKASWYDFRIGAEVHILYDPTDPEDVRVSDTESLWSAPVLVMMVGLIFAFLSWQVLHYRAQRQKADRKAKHEAQTRHLNRGQS
ncbi:MAG: DUF3592 domain-containing protein [Pseudomonadota bacterium]